MSYFTRLLREGRFDKQRGFNKAADHIDKLEQQVAQGKDVFLVVYHYDYETTLYAAAFSTQKQADAFAKIMSGEVIFTSIDRHIDLIEEE
ncbi:hypothetical protein [Methylocystis sp. ATCC 49242]|uniref:hypothetical protein n=1 Tax=Methylocystis sp. ATCC 49242 TaxID=622637 RepID=UPI0001F87107|nr:hypothetical protein [Methylocystis sp. ATCC 49242]